MSSMKNAASEILAFLRIGEERFGLDQRKLLEEIARENTTQATAEEPHVVNATPGKPEVDPVHDFFSFTPYQEPFTLADACDKLGWRRPMTRGAKRQATRELLLRGYPFGIDYYRGPSAWPQHRAGFPLFYLSSELEVNRVRLPRPSTPTEISTLIPADGRKLANPWLNSGPKL